MSLEDALATPPSRPDSNTPKDWRPRREISDDEAIIVTEARPQAGPSAGDAETIIANAGLDPAQWEVTGYRSSDWQSASGEWLSATRLSLRPAGKSPEGASIDELVELVNRHEFVAPGPLHGASSRAFVLASGDWQLGKIDGDGPEGAVKRVLRSIDQAKERYLWLDEDRGIDHVHLAFLGDCLEGFVSQGGANAWRTQLTLTEQIRLVRRLTMAHIEAFAPLTSRLTVTAVASNHGQAMRFGKSGVTTFDDDHGIEALVAVDDAIAHNPESFGHVEIYVPQRDEMTTTMEVGGTWITHAHGHQWKHGKHWEWLNTNAGNGHEAGKADILLAGHMHHLFLQEQGKRTFIQAPALEAESTYFRHGTGIGGNPGVLTFTTEGGNVHDLEVLR